MVKSMESYARKFLIKMPANLGGGNGYRVKLYKNEKEAAILESNGETYGFEVIAEITGNDFYSDNAIAARDGTLLILEIERRWLVKIPDRIKEYPYHLIEQAYLAPENGFQGRIRRLDDRYIYTEKARTGSAASRIENERDITAEEYEGLKGRTILNTVKKKRYLIPYGGLKFELDVFENTVETGYAIMEAELPEESTAIELPDFVEIVREVTEDEYYTNRNFASMDKIKLLK
ncbi:MAG: hypothetical protein K2N60_11580 [Oscillospiraceae bacterium]|nr:hypothetical protein [Oscillospiraceae bacterium]